MTITICVKTVRRRGVYIGGSDFLTIFKAFNAFIKISIHRICGVAVELWGNCCLQEKNR
jgi:hypothetical protein